MVGMVPAILAGMTFAAWADIAGHWPKVRLSWRGLLLGSASGLFSALIFLLLLWLARGADLSPHVGKLVVFLSIALPSIIAGGVCGLLVVRWLPRLIEQADLDPR
jgi:hypothetical protein